MNDNIISLVKSLSVGRCYCRQQGGSFSMSYDPIKGEHSHTSVPGTTIKCLRCRAREALDHDGVEYVKDDRVFYTPQN